MNLEIWLIVIGLGIFGGLMYLIHWLFDALWTFVDLFTPSRKDRPAAHECTHSDPTMWIYSESNSDVWCRQCGLRIQHVDPMSETPNNKNVHRP